MTKTVLVTGASAGIGKTTAIYLAQNGYNVYGAARRTDKMQDLRNYDIKPIALDVTKDDSMNTSPEKWLQNRRLDMAFFLISQKKKRPSEVYLEVGFENLSHFSTAFKNKFGLNASGVNNFIKKH